MHCGWILFLLCFVLCPLNVTCRPEEFILEPVYHHYGYAEYVGPNEYAEVDDRPDLGEGFIIQDNAAEDNPVQVVGTLQRLRRSEAEASSEDIEAGSGDEMEEITLTPPPKVPKTDNSSKKIDSKPPVDIPLESTSLAVSINDTDEEMVNFTTTEKPSVGEVTTETNRKKTTSKVLSEVTEDGNSLELQSASSVQWVPILIAVITSGIVFFFVGFFLDKCRRQRQEAQNPAYLSIAAKNKRDGFSHPDGVELQSIKTGGSPENRGNKIYHTRGSETTKGTKVQEEMLPLTETPAQFSTFKSAKKRQSPVAINQVMARYDEKLMKNAIIIKKEKKNYKMTNTGQTVRIEPDGESAVVGGGPLGKRQYLLDHFHFHWGSKEGQGSEHLLNGEAYDAEMHLVFSDTDISTFDEALKSEREDSLVVLAVFIEVGNENVRMKPITDIMANIEFKEESAEIEDFDVTTILPANLSEYWTYHGSLTTPSYSENVLWIVFKQPIQLSHKQFGEFRQLASVQKMGQGAGEGTPANRPRIGDNFRQTQPLQDRHISASFRNS